MNSGDSTLPRKVLHRTVIDSPIGSLTIVASDAGLRGVLFDNHSERFDDEVIDDEVSPVLAQAAIQLNEYFNRVRHSFSLPVDLVGTEFQVLAWQALAQIPYGQTVSYGEQASRIGRPSAVRAIGSANGRNPVSIVLPCHRVVGSDGSLVGFGGGLDKKRYLLELEGSLDSGLFDNTERSRGT